MRGAERQVEVGGQVGGRRDQRFLWRVLLAIGGVYLAVKLFRGMGQVFWTVFGLAMGLVWMFNGRLFPWG